MDPTPDRVAFAGEARVDGTTATAVLALLDSPAAATEHCRQLLDRLSDPGVEAVLAAFPASMLRIYALSTTRRAAGNLEGGLRVFADRSHANRTIAARNLQRLQRMLIDDRLGDDLPLLVAPGSLVARQLARGEIVWPGPPPQLADPADPDQHLWLSLAERLAADAARHLRRTASDSAWEHARDMGHRIAVAVGIH